MKDAKWGMRKIWRSQKNGPTRQSYEIFYVNPDPDTEPVIARVVEGTLAKVIIDTHNRDLESHGSA